MNSLVGTPLKKSGDVARGQAPKGGGGDQKKDPLAKAPEEIRARLVSRADKTPVSGAQYVVLDEKGNELAKGTTDQQGLVVHDVPKAGKYSIGVSDPPQSAANTKPAPKKDDEKKKKDDSAVEAKGGPSDIKPVPEPAPAPDGPAKDIEAQVIAGDYQKKGFYRQDGSGFVDPDLNALLKKYAQQVGVDPTQVESADGAGGKGSGDLEQSFAKGLPSWLGAFQKAAAGSASWGTKEQVLSRLMGAFYYRFFRKLYAKHNAAGGEKWAMPASVEYFLQHLGKSLSSEQQPGPPKTAFRANGNGKADFATIGGGGPNYCAAASSTALKKGLEMYGWKLNALGYCREHGLTMLKCVTPSLSNGILARPGDVLSIRSAGGPMSGHVVTVVFPIDMDGLKKGTMWVVSGNAMMNSVAVDFYSIEAGSGDRPPQGKIKILNLTTDSEIHFAHWAGEDLSRFKCSGGGGGAPDYPTTETEQLPDEPPPGNHPPDDEMPPATKTDPLDDKKGEDEKKDAKGDDKKQEPPPVVGDVQSKPKDAKQPAPTDIPIDAPVQDAKEEKEAPPEEKKEDAPPPDAKLAPKVLRTLNTMEVPAAEGDAKAMAEYVLRRAQEAPADVFSAPDYGVMPASPDEQWARAVAEHLTPLPYFMPQWFHSNWAKHLLETGEYPMVGQCQQSVSTALLFHGWEGKPFAELDCSQNTGALFKQKGELFKPASPLVTQWSEDDWKRLKPGSCLLWGQPDPKSNSGHIAIVLRKHPTERKFQLWDTGGASVRFQHQDDEPPAVQGTKGGSYEESWHQTIPGATNAPLIGIGNMPLGAVRTDLKARGVARLLVRSRADSKVLYRSKWIRMDQKGLTKLRLLRSLRGAPGSATLEARWCLNAFDHKKPDDYSKATAIVCDFFSREDGTVGVKSTGKCPDVGNFAKRPDVPKADWQGEPTDEGAKGAALEI